MEIRLPQQNAILRPVRESDAADVAHCCNDLQLAIDVGNPAFPHPYTLEHGKEFAAMASQPKGTFLHLCIAVNDKLVGMMGIVSDPTEHSAHAEVGYWVGAQARGQGLAAAGLDAFSQYAFITFPQLNRLEAISFDYNTASQRVLEKAGFTREAELKGRIFAGGHVLDEIIYARHKPQAA